MTLVTISCSEQENMLTCNLFGEKKAGQEGSAVQWHNNSS